MDGPQVAYHYTGKFPLQDDVAPVPDVHDKDSEELGAESSRVPAKLPFNLTITLYTLVVIGITFGMSCAAFGGALGSILSQKDHAEAALKNFHSTTVITTTPSTVMTATINHSTPSATTTALASNYAPLSPSQINSTILSCMDGAIVLVTTSKIYQYSTHCNADYPGNDIVSLIAYTFDDCLLACSQMNDFNSTLPCQGALFNSNMKNVVAVNHANCWLKSSMAGTSVSDVMPPSAAGILNSYQ